MKVFKHLVLSGGGINGICFIGAFKAIKQLTESKDFELKLESISAASAGVIIGMLIIAGYTPEELENIILDTDINDLKNISISTLLTKYGLDTGKKVIQWLTNLLNEKGFHSKITLDQFYKHTKIHFKIMATNLTKLQYSVFDYITYPEMPLLTAIRMSISIPFIFTHMKYENQVFVDGCLLESYPISLCKENLEETLGLRLVSEKDIELDNKNVHNDINNFIDYITAMSVVLLYNRDYTKYESNTINIKVDVKKSLDFSINNDDKKQLINSSFDCVLDFFKKSSGDLLATN